MDLARPIFGDRRASRKAGFRNKVNLNLINLEDRTVPIVGQTSIAGLPPAFAPGAAGMFTGADLVEPGSGYDGVVSIGSSVFGTGSLIKTEIGQGWGHHILTVAHAIKPLAASKVTFTMPRPGVATGVPIPITVPANSTMQISHISSVPYPGTNEFDIGIIRLIDPDYATPSSDRLLVPPYKAEQYTLHGIADEVKSPAIVVNIVGYGQTGAGLATLSDHLKRIGQNTIDIDGTPSKDAGGIADNNKTLSFDFDNGVAANDYMGKNYALVDTGLLDASKNPIDAMIAPGDSGGPWLVGKEIVGITRSNGRLAKVVITDVDGVINSSFGEFASGIRVSQYKGTFIEPIVSHGANYAGGVLKNAIDDKYNLTFDMKYQVYGQSGGVEDLTITLKNDGGKDGGRIQIWVSGPEGKLNDKYYDAPAKNIKELIIRGYDDNETINIIGDLGIAGNILVEGGKGKNEIIYDDSGATATRHNYTFGNNVPAGYDLRLNRAIGDAETVIGAIDSKQIKKYTLIGSPGVDKIVIEHIPATLTGELIVNAGAGDDSITVQNGPSLLGGAIQLHGEDGADVVRTDFKDDSVANTNYTLEKTPVGSPYDMRLSRENATTKSMAIDMKGIEQYMLWTGSDVDTIRIEKASAALIGGGGLPGGVHVDSGAGRDKIHVGAEKSSGMDEVKSDVYVTGGADDAHLYYQDKGGSTVVHQYTFGDTPADWDLRLNRVVNSVNVSMVQAKQIKRYELNASPAGDYINVNEVPSAASDGLFVNGLDGYDNISVGNTTGGLGKILGKVIVDGGVGDNKLIVDDKGGKSPATYLGGPTKFSRLFGADIEYMNIKEFTQKTAAGGKNNLFWLGKNPGTNYSINLFGGDNVVTLGNDNQSLDEFAGVGAFDIYGSVSTGSGTSSSQGSAYSDSLVFLDKGYSGGEIYGIHASSVNVGRLDSAFFGFSDIAKLTINSGSGIDNVDIDGIDNMLAVYVDGGEEDDTVAILSGEVLDPVLSAVENLDIAGGLLTLEENALAIGNVTQTGGILEGNATLTASNRLYWLGGIMRGNGDTVTGSGEESRLIGTLTLNERHLKLGGLTEWDAYIVPDEEDDPGTIENLGELRGCATFIGNFTNAGVLTPGNDGVAGSISIDGKFTQESGAELQFDFDNVSAQDWISVSGSIELAGTLSPYAFSDLTSRYLTVIENLGDSPIGGGFSSPSGVIDLGGHRYRLSYDRDGGNDAELINEKPTLDISDLTSDEGDQIDFQLSADDPEEDDLTYDIQGLPGGLQSDSSGRIWGTIGTHAEGEYTVTVLVYDDFDNDPLEVSFHWSVSNPAPVAIGDGYSTDEDTSLSGNVITDSISPTNDYDPDGDPLSARLVSDPSNGSVTLYSDGSFTYTPYADFNGTDWFTYVANDGTDDSNVATVTITVNPVNDTPWGSDHGYSVDEDGTLYDTVMMSRDDFRSFGGDYGDVDGDGLTAVRVTDASNGTVTLNSDGSFIYTPNANYNGSDSFTFSITDGSAYSSTQTAWLTVNSVNDAPVAFDDTLVVDEDSYGSIDVTSNDTDIDGDYLTVTSATGAAHGTLSWTGGTIYYTPYPDYNGSDSFTYEISDGNGGTATGWVSVTVNSVNDAPVAVDDSYSVDEDNTLYVSASEVLGNDSDPVEGSSLSARLVSDPSNGSVTLYLDGSFTYTPYADFNGTDWFTYVANDGTDDSNVATVTITVNPVNDAPWGSDHSYSVDEDGTLYDTVMMSRDWDYGDVDGDSLWAVLAGGPSYGSLSFYGDGSFSYTPNANYNGSDSFTFYITDGPTTSSIQTTWIMVNPVNDPPMSVDDWLSVDEDSWGQVDFLSNDSDLDGDSLTVIGAAASNGSVVWSGGTIYYAPNANFNGSDSITYTITDGNGGYASATVWVTVNPSNDGPTVSVMKVSDAYECDPDTQQPEMGRFVFSRTGGDLEEEITVTFTITGSATYLSDYTMASDAELGLIGGTSSGDNDFTYDATTQTATIRFKSGELTKDVWILPVADNTTEGIETVDVLIIGDGNYGINPNLCFASANMADEKVGPDRKIDTTKDVTTYNCAGLAFRNYEYMSKEKVVAELAKGKECKSDDVCPVGSLKIVYYDVTDYTFTNPLNGAFIMTGKLQGEFHIVGIRGNGNNAVSKNNTGPVTEPGPLNSFLPTGDVKGLPPNRILAWTLTLTYTTNYYMITDPNPNVP